MEDLVRQFLQEIGEDPEREGLKKTPGRVERCWKFLTRGYTQDLDTVVNGALFEAESDDMVIVRDIEFFSMCEHHLLPFFGRCHVGYIPNGRIIGVSKVARIVDMFARRLQVQERLTNQIADFIEGSLDPLGVAVIIEAEHLCMTMRGARAAGSMTQTSALRGLMRSDARSRAEVLSLLKL